jgi:spermidine/putrescine transport system ATP-binding protein
MTVRDNVAFGLRMKKVPPAQLVERVERVLALTQITELAERRPVQLSGGQKQRAALARALVNEPEVLLLDEPLGALDLKLRKQLQVELHQLQRHLGITFIYVTHDQEEALVMSDRIAVMNAGRIEQLDEARALYERPRTQFVAQFLGACNLINAAVNELNGDFFTATAAFGLIQANFSEPSAGLAMRQTVTLAIRPEKVALVKPGDASGTNFFDARIADLVYSGAETQYRLVMGDHALNAVVLNSAAGHQGFQVGETVSCHLPADSLIVLDD